MPDNNDSILSSTMTHWPEQQNPAQPYLDLVSQFRQGGISEILKNKGYQIPQSVDWLGQVLNNPNAQTAMGMAGGFWSNPKNVELLKQLKGQGKSLGLIASELGVGRGAVAGKLDRLGLLKPEGEVGNWAEQTVKKTKPDITKIDKPKAGSAPLKKDYNDPTADVSFTAIDPSRLLPSGIKQALSSYSQKPVTLPKIGFMEKPFDPNEEVIANLYKAKEGDPRRSPGFTDKATAASHINSYWWKNPEKVNELIQHKSDGLTHSQIADKFGVTRSTIGNMVKRLKDEGYL
jgi:hypothetical protein